MGVGNQLKYCHSRYILQCGSEASTLGTCFPKSCVKDEVLAAGVTKTEYVGLYVWASRNAKTDEAASVNVWANGSGLLQRLTSSR
jgi:hypothetical protein